MSEACGFKLGGCVAVKQELTNQRKAGEGAWTSPSQRAGRIKLLGLAVVTRLARGASGRWLSTESHNEHDTTHGGDDGGE